MSDFSSLVSAIENAYETLDHEPGWRFLYTPSRTFSAETRLAFVPANTGGGRYEAPKPSVEEGNAYRVERWGQSGGTTSVGS